MTSIYMIIAALTATALAQGSIKCSFSETAGAQQCHGAVGQLLLFNLPDTADKEIRLKKDEKYLIFKLNKNKMETSREYTNNPELYANGSLKLGEATKKHSGDYTLEEHGLNGVLMRTQHVHLEIQAPVSKPAVSQTCMSREKMNVSCSSEGEKVEFVLTLDDHSLSQTSDNSTFLNSMTEKTLTGTTEEIKPSGSSVTISLNGHLVGNLVCYVQNNVSREETVMRLKSCKALVSKPAVSQTCLSPEKMNISCSSEGDGVEFTLILDDNLLIQTRDARTFLYSRTEKTQYLAGMPKEDKPSVSSVSISLNGQLTGNLMCNAQNNISREETIIQLKSCKVSSSYPEAVTMIRTLLPIFLLVALSCGLSIRRNTKPVAVYNDFMDDPEKAVINTDVILMQNMGATEPNSNQNSTESPVNCTVHYTEAHDRMT